jgi:hemerythrin
MALAWDNNLELGVPEIDDQHREIFNYFEKLSTACQAGQGESVLDDVFRFLDDYVAHHFSSEEALMQQHGYPGLTEQQEQHALFRQEIEALRNQPREAGQEHELALAIDRQLVRWLIRHIRNQDREMVEYITSQ